MNEKMNANEIQWSALLAEAVKRPGSILEAYSNFHNYSIGNCMLAAWQCHARGIALGPIATYNKWRELGRQVRRGEKALTLCMPRTVKAKAQSEDGEDEETFRTYFVYKRFWFVLEQTDGDDYELPAIPQWDKARALEGLGIREETFTHLNGNVQGYAKAGRVIAINPAAQLPHKTLFHELGHQILGHVSEGDRSETETLSRNLDEAEAEGVALICCEALGLAGADYCRGYIQSWLAGAEIPERSCRRIFSAANAILEAGKAGAE
jgi:antirestriction protein ArdC